MVPKTDPQLTHLKANFFDDTLKAYYDYLAAVMKQK